MSETMPEPASAEDLRAHIERTRNQLAETVDALAAKADVKGRAREKAHEVTDNVKDDLRSLRDRAAGLAGTVKDKAVEARDAASGKAGELRDRTSDPTDTTDRSPGALLDSGAHAAGSHGPGGIAAPPADASGNTASGNTAGEDGAGALASARDRLGSAAHSAAGAAAGAATAARDRVAGAVGHETGQTNLEDNVLAPRPRSTAVTAGAVAGVLALIATVVLLRRRRKADR